MAGGDFPLAHLLLHAVRQGEQPHGVGHGAAAFAKALGGHLLGQAVFFNELAAALCHLDGVQILPLQIFNECQRGGLFVGDFLDDDRHLVQTRHAAGPPAALTRDDDVPRPRLFGPHRDGLQQAVLLDAGAQLSQCLLVKGLAGLFRIRLDVPDGQRAGGGDVLGLRQVGKKAVQPFAKPSQFFLCHCFTTVPVRIRCSPKIPGPVPCRRRCPCRLAHNS